MKIEVWECDACKRRLEDKRNIVNVKLVVGRGSDGVEMVNDYLIADLCAGCSTGLLREWTESFSHETAKQFAQKNGGIRWQKI